jgi:type II secretory pathway pseudopilin PulG
MSESVLVVIIISLAGLMVAITLKELSQKNEDK